MSASSRPLHRFLTGLGFAVATGLAILSGSASAASLVYQLTGTIHAQNAAAVTLRDTAGFQRGGNDIPFQARIELDADAAVFVINNLPSQQNHAYDDAVKSMAISIGGFNFQTTRPLFHAPRGSFASPWNEATTEVANMASPTGIDMFVIETTDRSATPQFPGPKQATFNTYSQPINLVLAGRAYDTLNFRAEDIRLQLGGINLWDSPDLPQSIRLGNLNPLLSSFRLDMLMQFTGPNGALASGNAVYSAQVLDLSVTAVPEPSAWALTLAGLLAVSGVVRRRGAKPS
jgi:hypothetical protein